MNTELIRLKSLLFKLNSRIWLFMFIILIPSGLFGSNVPAFPGAEGFGRHAKGGRGGQIVLVTNLNNDGPGSLREALEKEGPRLVLFSVSGIINLETPIYIRNPFITIAGHTAPERGIAIRGNQLHIQTHDVVIRFLRIRVGDINFGETNHWRSLDGIDIGWGNNIEVYNIIIDHCSISWASDENIGTWGSVYNITIQNCIISEGLNFDKHNNSRGLGILIGPLTERISILNNLFIHNGKRNPRMGNGGVGDVRNNIIYNPGWMGMNIWNDLLVSKPQNLNIVNNIFISGPDTEFDKEISVWDPDIYPGKIYLSGNIGFDGNVNKDNWFLIEDAKHPRDPISLEQIQRIKSNIEFPYEETYTKSYEEMMSYTNKYIGACLPIRDEVDQRLINDLEFKKGQIISSQDEVGGWPVYDRGLALIPLYGKSNDYDVIPEEWRKKYSIWPGQENEDFNGNGYTNIEEFINGTDPLSPNKPTLLDIFPTFGYINANGIKDLSLKQNVPNPFETSTRINFSIQRYGRVILEIYNNTGMKLFRLVDSELFPGSYEIIWNPVGLPSGYYIATLYLNNSETQSVAIIKN